MISSPQVYGSVEEVKYHEEHILLFPVRYYIAQASKRGRDQGLFRPFPAVTMADGIHYIVFKPYRPARKLITQRVRGRRYSHLHNHRPHNYVGELGYMKTGEAVGV